MLIPLSKDDRHTVIIDLNTVPLNNICLSFNFTDAPKDINATVTPLDVIEGQKLTLSCSAKGRPSPTFQWSHNGFQVSTQAQWTIPSVKYSQAGTYSCVAWNAHGLAQSPPSQIKVSCKSLRYLPQFGSFSESFAILYYLSKVTDELIREKHSSGRFLIASLNLGIKHLCFS